MAMDVSRVNVWAAELQDKPGSLACKLDSLAEAGANLEFVIARRCDKKRGTGVVFVTPLKGAKQLRVAKKIGFAKTDTLHSVRVEGPDKPGVGSKMTAAVAEAGINLRGLSAAAMKKRFIVHLAFDSSGDATKAVRLIKGM